MRSTRRTPAVIPTLLTASLLALPAVLAGGCDSNDKPTTRPMSFRERQDQALRDPMNYKPSFDNDRISSGGIMDFDKQGFQKDLGRVLNP